jgi:hypothetical protein
MSIGKHSWDIFLQYVTVMNEYLSHFSGSEKYKKGEKDCNYLLLNGFSTLTHVFKITLNRAIKAEAIKAASEAGTSEAGTSEAGTSEAGTSEAGTSEAEAIKAASEAGTSEAADPLTQAAENTERAIYYYTQFIEQMEENIMHDLNVSSNNASLFVYKKTIYDLQSNTASNTLPLAEDTALTLKNFDYLLLIYRNILDSLLQAENYNSFIPTKLINIALEICQNNHNEINFRAELANIMFFVNHFPERFKDSYIYIYLYLKKYKQQPLSLEWLCHKKSQPNYSKKLLNEPAANYIKWLLR